MKTPNANHRLPVGLVPLSWTLVCAALGCGRVNYDPLRGDVGPDAVGLDAVGFDAPRFDVGSDAAGLDASAGPDAPGFDAPEFDAPGFDAPRFDAPVDLDARPAVDAARADAGPLPDAPFSDAGSLCPTVGVMVGSSANPAALSAFGLTQSADGSRGARSFVFSTGAGASSLGGGSLGPGFFAMGLSGPSSVALLNDGIQGAHVFTHVTGGIRFVSFGGSSVGELMLGGACPSSRCIAEFNGNFAVLRGPTTLSLIEVSTATALVGTATSVAMGTSAGAIRSISEGALVTYSSGGACILQRWPDRAASTAAITVLACRQLDMAELSDGQIALTWIDSTFDVRVALTDAALTVLTAEGVLDGAQSALQPAEVNATSSGFRVTWLDDLPTPLLRSVRFNAAGTPQTSECAATPTHVLADYRQFHAVRRGSTSAVEWVQDNDFYGVTYTD